MNSQPVMEWMCKCSSCDSAAPACVMLLVQGFFPGRKHHCAVLHIYILHGTFNMMHCSCLSCPVKHKFEFPVRLFQPYQKKHPPGLLRKTKHIGEQ